MSICTNHPARCQSTIQEEHVYLKRDTRVMWKPNDLLILLSHMRCNVPDRWGPRKLPKAAVKMTGSKHQTVVFNYSAKRKKSAFQKFGCLEGRGVKMETIQQGLREHVPSVGEQRKLNSNNNTTAMAVNP